MKKLNQLIGEKSKKVYKIGDRVKVMLIDANVPLRQIEFSVVEKLKM